MRRRTVVGLHGLVAAAGIYGNVWRSWQLTWEATSDEVARPLLGILMPILVHLVP